MRIHPLISKFEELQALVDRLSTHPFVAVDTEFMSENTYWPDLCLIQVASSDEAAAIDRAGGWYTFTRITLPLVAPILLIALIFRTMEAFKTFDIAFTMTSQPAAELIAVRLYKQAFQQWDTGKSCALAYIILIMVLAITNMYVKYLNRAKER